MQTSKKTRLRTFRIEEHLDSILQKDAKSKGISVNSLLSLILTRYAEWDRYIEKFGTITVKRDSFKMMLSAINDDKVTDISQELGDMVPSQFVLFWFKKNTLENYLKYISLICKDGGFAQYVAIPEQIIRIGGLVPVPETLTDEEAALLEPVACCLNSFSRMASVAKSSSIVIIGDGPMGLIHLQLFKRLLRSSKVAIVGKVQSRMVKAHTMDADAVFAYSEGTAADILDFAGPFSGAGAVVIATSNPAAFELAKKVAGRDSTVNVFAGMPSGQTFLLDPNWLHYNQISISGSFSSTPGKLREAARIVADKTIDLSTIVTHRYSLDEIEKAIDVTENYYGLRAVINKF